VTQHLESAELLAFAAASERDPAFATARAHLDQCAECQARLRESQALMALLDGIDEPPRISPALRARVHERAFRRAEASAWGRLGIAAATLVSMVLAYLDGRGSDLRLGDLVPDLGAHCLLFQGAFAAIPLVVGMTLSRAGRVQVQPLVFAAWTMSFALLGQVVLRTHCNAYNLSVHLFAVHFVGVLLAGFIGGGVGRALASAR